MFNKVSQMSYNQAFGFSVIVKELISCNGDYDAKGAGSGLPEALERQNNILNFIDEEVHIETDLMQLFMSHF